MKPEKALKHNGACCRLYLFICLFVCFFVFVSRFSSLRYESTRICASRYFLVIEKYTHVPNWMSISNFLFQLYSSYVYKIFVNSIIVSNIFLDISTSLVFFHLQVKSGELLLFFLIGFLLCSYFCSRARNLAKVLTSNKTPASRFKIKLFS